MRVAEDTGRFPSYFDFLAIQKGAYPAIKVVALNEPVVSRTLVLVSRKTAHLSPAAQALYDMIGKQGQT